MVLKLQTVTRVLRNMETTITKKYDINDNNINNNDDGDDNGDDIDNKSDNCNDIERPHPRFVYDLFAAQPTVSSTCAQVASAQSCANHV